MDNYRNNKRDSVSHYDDNRGQYDDRSLNSDSQQLNDFGKIDSDHNSSRRNMGQSDRYSQPTEVGRTGEVITHVKFPLPSLEDRMLMKSINRESFWYRCIPLGIVSSAAYYYYNEQKKKPHNIMKYTGLFFVAYIFGKLSYYQIGQRRLLESSSNSPFIQELRRIASGRTGLNSLVSSNRELFKSDTSEMNWNDPGHNEFTPDASMQDPSQPYQLPDQTTSLTYDELRAKNRESYEKNKKF